LLGCLHEQQMTEILVSAVALLTAIFSSIIFLGMLAIAVSKFYQRSLP